MQCACGTYTPITSFMSRLREALALLHDEQVSRPGDALPVDARRAPDEALEGARKDLRIAEADLGGDLAHAIGRLGEQMPCPLYPSQQQILMHTHADLSFETAAQVGRVHVLLRGEVSEWHRLDVVVVNITQNLRDLPVHAQQPRRGYALPRRSADKTALRMRRGDNADELYYRSRIEITYSIAARYRRLNSRFIINYLM